MTCKAHKVISYILLSVSFIYVQLKTNQYGCLVYLQSDHGNENMASFFLGIVNVRHDLFYLQTRCGLKVMLV